MDNLTFEYKQICSSETVYSLKKGFFYDFYESAKQAVGLAYIFNLFANLEEDRDRIIKMYNENNINLIIINKLNSISVIYKKKDAITSKKIRINCLHKEKNQQFNDILRYLNQAVLHAPEIGTCAEVDDGYTLPLAIITRANVLLKQSNFIDAYEDLKIVRELKLPFLNTKKMFENLFLCRSRQNQMIVYDFKAKLCKKWKAEILNQYSNCSAMSNLVKIRKSSSAGNEAIANFVINPGEALVIENPTASCLLPEFYNSHCQTCLRRCKIIYGCPDCTTISFCSYKCRNIGLKSFHKYECKISSILIGSGMSILTHLALRIITQLGLQKCIILYRHLYEDLGEFENEIIVGTLLLKHLQFLQFNTHEVYDNNNGCNLYKYSKINPIYIGVGIYSTVAKFNHQCYSATIRYFIGNLIILRSSRLLQINDVIAENYGPVFIKKTVVERKRYLAGRYWFNCYCQACIDNWPLLHEMKYIHVLIRCNSNSCTGCINVFFGQNFEKLYFCKHCGVSQKFSRLHQNIIKKCILWYAYGITIMDKHYINEAAQILLIALRIFHHIANVPYRFTHLAEISLQYCLINN